MLYVFDSGPLIDLFRHYYRGVFSSLWESFDTMIAAGKITSTREVLNEIGDRDDDLSQWCKNNQATFPTPDTRELEVVRDIFQIPHFQAMIRRRERMAGKPVADPFVIARAKRLSDAIETIVVTTEHHTPNAAKVPNVCEHFGVGWDNLEGFMEREGWQF